MEINNFKELEKEQIKQFDQNTKKVGDNIKSNIDNFRFVGSILELYLVRSLDFLLDLSKQEDNKGQ